jgi:rhodanese-related sulfurtransferase
LVLLVLALAAFSVAGCGGSGNATTGSSPPLLVSPGEFEQAVAEPSRVTINVHVPDEGSIPGTDRSIPFDEIEVRQAELPDPSTPLAVYCRSGRMSAIAVETLAKLGFDDVVELQGGMKAWAGAGKPIVPPGSG